MPKADERIPGITFHLLISELAPPPEGSPYTALGSVHIGADVTDLNLWEETIKKFEGMRIYAVETGLHEEMITLLQEDTETLNQELDRKTEEFRSEKERLLAELQHQAHEIAALKLEVAKKDEQLAIVDRLLS